jgi:hypothetical protein
MESFTTGTIAGDGTFRCEECGAVGPLARTADVPACPQCGSTRVGRASLFSPRITSAGDAAGDQELDADVVVATALEHVPSAGRYLTFVDGDEIRLVTLDGDQTRIGRSLTADLRFDDPTVSRRHALLVRQDEGIRLVDDRSLNGVFVNGERVDWRMLRHGDEVVVGRYRLFFLDTAAQRTGESTETVATV